MKRKPVLHAERIAAWMRRNGYPDAKAAPEYCVDEIGMDNFYTYNVAVYAGKRVTKEQPRHSIINWLWAKLNQ